MILADTSIRIGHIREPNPVLSDLLATNRLLMHRLVIGELSVGNLPVRNQFIHELERLTPVTEARHEEVLDFMHVHRLYGRGVGWIDLHLLASVKLGSGQAIWSRDRRLTSVAEELGVSARPVH